MAHKKEPGSAWRQTTVLVRADIYTRAQEQEINISDACNRALADLLGIDYRQQQLDAVPVPPPVIIARDGGMPAPSRTEKIPDKNPQPPVINADDPKAAGAIAVTRKQPVKKTVPQPPSPETPVPETRAPKVPAKAATPAPAAKARKAKPNKTGKKDVLKNFIAAMIVRQDSEDAIIAKDDLYQFFSRWCRAQKVSPVPEAKSVAVALKTRFAFREKSSGGKPCWAGVRLRE